MEHVSPPATDRAPGSGRSRTGLVLLTARRPETHYVADVLAAAFGDELRAIVVADPPAISPLARVRRYRQRYSTTQLLSRVWARTYSRLTGRERRRAATYRRRFYPAGDPGGFARAELVRSVPSHNGEECRRLLEELRPDIIAVYGTSVIRSPIIRLAPAILNMHTGVSPRYRGADSVFWALHNEEPEWVGVTVHFLNEGIDSGPIVRGGRPPIAADDDEDSLFCKSVILGAHLYVEAIREVAAGGGPYAPQVLGHGREYRFVDRTVAADRRVARALRHGLLHRFAGPR